MGQVAAVIDDVKPAKEIIDEMVVGASERLTTARSFILVGHAKL